MSALGPIRSIPMLYLWNSSGRYILNFLSLLGVFKWGLLSLDPWDYLLLHCHQGYHHTNPNVFTCHALVSMLVNCLVYRESLVYKCLLTRQDLWNLIYSKKIMYFLKNLIFVEQLTVPKGKLISDFTLYKKARQFYMVKGLIQKTSKHVLLPGLRCNSLGNNYLSVVSKQLNAVFRHNL